MKSKLPACFAISSAFFEITTSCAPNRLPSATLLSEVVNITTFAPNAFANFTPMCPSPPRPTTPTFCPFCTFQWRIGEYVVIPAHKSGAAPARFNLSEMLSTNASSTTMPSEYPPYVTPPKCLSGALYVSVGKLSQYCSAPAKQFGQVRSESTMQPTPTVSPTLNFFTALPTFATRPTISCPGTHG